MVWKPELILLAPRVLSKRKPLEHQSFIGLYTGLLGMDSKGFIFLVYAFKNIEEEKDIEGWLVCEQTYHDKRYWYRSEHHTIIKYTIFILKAEDSRELEDYKKTGNLGFEISEWYSIFKFWGDLNKDIKFVVDNTITDLDLKFE